MRRGLRIRRSVDLARDEPDDGRAGLVLRTHEFPRTVRPELLPPGLRDPVRIRVRERRLGRRRVGQRLDERADPVREPAEHGVRERHRPLETGTSHELDRLVHRGVARDPVDERELIRAEAKRSPHGSIESRDASSAERLDRVVERPGALDRAVRRAAGRARDRVRPARRPPSGERGPRTRRPRRPAAGRREPRRVPGLRSQTAKPCLVRHAPSTVGLHFDRLERSVLGRPEHARP